MKAIVYTSYGSPDVLQLKEIAKPTPKDNEILVRVYATSIGFGDILARKFDQISPRDFSMPFFLWLPARIAIGISKPNKHILGSEFAGEVEGVGSAVKRFQRGDKVFGFLSSNFGANAEYLCMPETGVVALKPTNMSYEEAAVVPYGALTALSLLKKVNIQPGQKVLINGASGAIGSAAVQLAKNVYGAHVTGVCGTPRLDFVKQLGADAVIDYTREDFTQNGETYDLIFDILGKSTFSRCQHSLTPNGRYLLASFKTKQLLQMLWTSKMGSQKVICTLSSESPEALEYVKELAEAGKLKSILDRCYPLEQTAEAHRYIEAGHKQGNVVITIAPC